MCQDGNMVVFGADRAALRKLAESDTIYENCIMNKRSGVKSKINNDGGLYTYPIWQKRRIGKSVTTVDNCKEGDNDGWSPF